jgi:hypothetical protein
MGKEIYFLHDNGRKLFDSARTCTPIQRFVYVLARDHHTEDHESPDPGGFDKSKKFNQATSKF